jgi:drug/metabolite transporter (DMT)-like permease
VIGFDGLSKAASDGVVAPAPPMRAGAPWWVAVCAGLALVAFASNSILCRGALGAGTIDPGTFTLVRLACGAVTLAVIVGSRSAAPVAAPYPWSGALALCLYAVAFSFAYVRIGAAVGALVLFAATQVTMLGWAIHRGERPTPVEWLGIGVALAGLVGLTAPGATAPDLAGVAMMACAGVGWGIYSLLGRGRGDPVVSNARAFQRAVLPAAAIALAPLSERLWTARGLAFAAISGSLASGVGYSLWYAALPHLSRTRAAALQLAVPAIAAAAGVSLLGERPTLRLLVCGVAITGGVALTFARAARQAR